MLPLMLDNRVAQQDTRVKNSSHRWCAQQCVAYGVQQKRLRRKGRTAILCGVSWSGSTACSAAHSETASQALPPMDNPLTVNHALEIVALILKTLLTIAVM